MTIESIITAQTMIGDGVNRHWPFTFKAWEGEIRAVVLSGHLETDVTADCDITLNSGPGGLVVYPRLAADAPLPAGVKITILRDMDFLQNTELVNAARFDPHVIEEQFDRLVAEDQQLLEGLGRALQVAPGESAPSISAFLAG
ncbi:MAG: hypothetical protein LBO77_01565, partial [Desulfovibrio sp.]|nr:hypothetical protein [Desulfovibrio sp.]